MSFTARYDKGVCDNCLEPIKEGQEIEYDATDVLVHVGCKPPKMGETKFQGTTLDDMGY